MTNVLRNNGVAGLTKVTSQFTGPNAVGNLTAAVTNRAPGAAITSCAVTASIVADVLSAKPTQHVPAMHGKSESQKVDAIADLLRQPKMVAISIQPDHHFVVLPVDTDMVVLLQGFQGAYTVAEWLNARGTGIIRKSEFIQHMRDLTGAANAPRVLAALALFSFEGAADPLKMSLFVYAKAQRVRQTVDAWFNGKTVKINTIVHRDL